MHTRRNHYIWETLPDTLRSEWERLGWGRDSFDGHVPPPPSEDLQWGELLEEQRDAAVALGYTQVCTFSILCRF